MTREEFVRKNSWVLGVIRDRCGLTQAEKDYLNHAIEYLGQEHCEDAISMSVIEALDMAIEALSAEPCEDAISRRVASKIIEDGLDDLSLDYIDDEQYDALQVAIKVLKQEPCEDAISRPDVIYLADELKDDLPDDERMADIVTAHNEGILEYQTKLSLLPPVTPKQKMGHWIHFAWSDDCSECGWSTGKYGSPTKYCPNCGAKMGESDGRK